MDDQCFHGGEAFRWLAASTWSATAWCGWIHHAGGNSKSHPPG